jgi:hypothetical protein
LFYHHGENDTLFAQAGANEGAAFPEDGPGLVASMPFEQENNIPPGLKPGILCGSYGTAEAVPFQSLVMQSKPCPFNAALIPCSV